MTGWIHERSFSTWVPSLTEVCRLSVVSVLLKSRCLSGKESLHACAFGEREKMRLRTRRSCLLLYCIPYYKYGERFYEVKALFKPDFPRNMIEKWSRLPYVSKVLSLVLECMSVIVCWKSKSSERDLLKRNQNKNKIIKQRSLLHYTILNFHQISYTKCLIIVQLIIDLKVEEVLKI